MKKKKENHEISPSSQALPVSSKKRAGSTRQQEALARDSKQRQAAAEKKKQTPKDGASTVDMDWKTERDQRAEVRGSA